MTGHGAAATASKLDRAKGEVRAGPVCAVDEALGPWFENLALLRPVGPATTSGAAPEDQHRRCPGYSSCCLIRGEQWFGTSEASRDGRTGR